MLKYVCTVCLSLWKSNLDLSSQQAEPVMLGKDVAVVSGLLEVVVILWRSVEKALKQNEEAHKYTVAKFGNVMSKYFQTFEVHQLHCVVLFVFFL